MLRGPGKEWKEEGWKEAFNWGGTSQKGREKKKLLLQLLPLLDYLAHAHMRAGRRSQRWHLTSGGEERRECTENHQLKKFRCTKSGRKPEL